MPQVGRTERTLPIKIQMKSPAKFLLDDLNKEKNLPKVDRIRKGYLMIAVAAIAITFSAIHLKMDGRLSMATAASVATLVGGVFGFIFASAKYGMEMVYSKSRPSIESVLQRIVRIHKNLEENDDVVATSLAMRDVIEGVGKDTKTMSLFPGLLRVQSSNPSKSEQARLKENFHKWVYHIIDDIRVTYKGRIT